MNIFTRRLTKCWHSSYSYYLCKYKHLHCKYLTTTVSQSYIVHKRITCHVQITNLHLLNSKTIAISQYALCIRGNHKTSCIVHFTSMLPSHQIYVSSYSISTVTIKDICCIAIQNYHFFLKKNSDFQEWFSGFIRIN